MQLNKSARKQRLVATEEQLRILGDGMTEAEFRKGLALKEIHDDELWKDEGFPSFEKYCRRTFDLSKREVESLIKQATVWQMVRELGYDRGPQGNEKEEGNSHEE